MNVIAVTSCPTGVAASHMAAAAITRICAEKGYPCKVEVQGALGIENELLDSEIEKADIVILANDIALISPERFEKISSEKVRKIPPMEIVKDSRVIFTSRSKNADGILESM